VSETGTADTCGQIDRIQTGAALAAYRIVTVFHSPHPPDHSGDHDDRDEVPAAVVVAGKSGSMAADHCSGGLLRMDLPEAVLEPV